MNDGKVFFFVGKVVVFNANFFFFLSAENMREIAALIISSKKTGKCIIILVLFLVQFAKSTYLF